jgi:uncharacterized membrane protein YphA (DoxX/SURF4 family)
MSVNNYLDNIAKPLQGAANWLLRLPLGIVFITHGYQKIGYVSALIQNQPAEGFANMLAQSGIPFPSLTAALVSLGEMGSGIGIILGGLLGAKLGHLVTRLSGGAILVIMIGAFFIRHSDWLWTLQAIDSQQGLLISLGTYFAIKGNQ